jgi:hypothetical protein
LQAFFVAQVAAPFPLVFVGFLDFFAAAITLSPFKISTVFLSKLKVSPYVYLSAWQKCLRKCFQIDLQNAGTHIFMKFSLVTCFHSLY